MNGLQRLQMVQPSSQRPEFLRRSLMRLCACRSSANPAKEKTALALTRARKSGPSSTSLDETAGAERLPLSLGSADRPRAHGSATGAGGIDPGLLGPS